MNEDDKLPFTAHLEELRTRLIRCLIAVGIGFTGAYLYKEKLFDILTRPLVAVMGKGDTLIFTGLAEAFFTYLKTAFIVGVMLASPVIIFEFWMFVAPGLYKTERRILMPVVVLSTLFFIGGALFGYFFVFPVGFEFFLGFQSETIKAMPSMREYLGFAATMLLVFGLTFELPLVITCLARFGLVTVDFLKKNRKYAILLIFIVAAILTPPDVVSQTMMAIPMMLLYEISIVGARIFGKKPDAEKERDADSTA
ncbi:MAG: twin-arginine translocase subunit TatC [Thermodesulfobacteriota bacterium]